MKDIKIHTEYITLVQLLKMCSIISSGGEIIFFMQENDVYYNGELESRKRKKLYPGDVVSINEEEFFRICE